MQLPSPRAWRHGMNLSIAAQLSTTSPLQGGHGQSKRAW
jgi:hypothetical protein